MRRLHRNAKDQGIRGSVFVPVSTFTFLFEEIDVETYIIPKRILNDTRIIAQSAVYKGAIVFLDTLGSEVKSYISIKLLCGGELWHGCQGSRLYTDLQTALPLFPPPNKTRDLHGTFIYKYWAFDREKRNVYIVITIYIKHKSARISL